MQLPDSEQSKLAWILLELPACLPVNWGLTQVCNDPHKQLLAQVSAVLIPVQSPPGDKETTVTHWEWCCLTNRHLLAKIQLIAGASRHLYLAQVMLWTLLAEISFLGHRMEQETLQKRKDARPVR